MSLATDGFTFLGTLKVPSLSGATASNVALLIKANAFTTAMVNDLKADGGDLRLSSDSAGNTQLPVEIVDGLDYVWTRVASVQINTLVYVWGNKPAATQPAEGAAFGRDAVWVDFEVNYHFNSSGILIDSTGNQNLTQAGSPTSVTGQVGDAANCAASYSNRFTAVGYTGITGSGARTVSLWSKSTASADRGITSWGENNNGLRWSVYLQGGQLRTEVQGGFKLSDTASANNTFQRLTSVYDGTTFPSGLTHRVNGVDEPSYTQSGSRTINTTNANNVVVAAFDQFGSVTIGSDTTDEFGIRAFAISANQDAIETGNQGATGGWWIATDASGGGITPTGIASGEAFGTPSLTLGTVTLLPSGITSEEAVGSPTLINQITIAPLGIESLEAFGNSVIEMLLQNILASGTPSGEAFGNTRLTGGDVLLIPTAQRQSWNAVAAYLRTFSFKGSDNDVIIAWLRSEGIVDGTYNDLWNKYLLQNGFTALTLADNYAAWRQNLVTALFENGVLICSGTLSCSEIIPCGE